MEYFSIYLKTMIIKHLMLLSWWSLKYALNLFDISGMIRKFIQRSCPTINKIFFNEFVLGLGNCMSNLLPLRL